MKKKSIKPILLKLPYLAFVYLFDKLTEAIRLSLREDVMKTLLAMGEGFAEAFDTFAPSFHPVDLTVAVIGTGLIFLVMYVRGLEAESVAYTVCQHYGLDTSDYYFGYVAGWSSGREMSELKSSLETISATAAEIIDSIDAHIAEI